MSYITTNSKSHFYPQKPVNEDIKIQDIAHALSYLCRANGHFDRFYSVAQHSINCAMEAKARGLSKDVQLACLLHDASEAYISDITRPVKKLLPEYLDIEEHLQEAIYEKYGVVKQDYKMVSEIDDTLLHYEFFTMLGEKVFDFEPMLISKPDFSERNYKYVKNEFLELFTEFTTDNKTFKSIGIDGCKGGWMVAVLSNNKITIERYNTIEEVLIVYKFADSYIIDIPIGLPETKEEAEYRPDSLARKILGKKHPSVFPTPFRQVARAETTNEAWEIDRKLNSKIGRMGMGIRSSVNDVDLFLQGNPQWKNILNESHPEVCFVILNNCELLKFKKTEVDGLKERLNILKMFGIDTNTISEHPLYTKYSDDVLDAVCLALIGSFVTLEKYKTLPSEDKIQVDSTGLKMQMVIPNCDNVK